MGQRLVINITYGEKIIASAYYHWSGYTDSAASLTADICDFLHYVEGETAFVQAVLALQHTGAGLNEEEWERVHSSRNPEFNTVQFLDATDRNIGLLKVTPEGIESHLAWVEELVTINLTRRTVSFDVFNWTTVTEYKEEYGMDVSDLPYYSYMDPPPFISCSIESFPDASSFIEENPNGCVCGEGVYLWIE